MISFRQVLPLGVVLLFAGCNPQASWRELKLPADSVRVQMPTRWTEQKDSDGQRIYQAVHGRTEYLLGVGSVPHPTLSAEQARDILRQVRDAMVQKLPSGKLVSEGTTEVEGRPGIEFKARGSNDEVVEARLFLTNQMLVTLLVDYQDSPPSQANVEKYLASLTFNMDASSGSAAVAPPVPAPDTIQPPPPPMVTTATEDKRSAWRYTDAPQIFPDQKGYNGLIRKTMGNRWVDETETGPLEFLEESRTPDYVELKRPVGDFRVRLYDDRSEYKFGYDQVWKPMFPGKWE